MKSVFALVVCFVFACQPCMSIAQQDWVPYRQGEFVGYSDSNGKIMLTPQWREAGFFDSSGRAVVIAPNGAKSLINTKGEYRIPIDFFWNGNYNGLKGATFNAHNNSNEWGFIDTVGNVLIPFKYDVDNIYYPHQLDFRYDEGEKIWYKVTCLKGKYGVIDNKGNTLIPFEFSDENNSPYAVTCNKNNYPWDSSLRDAPLLFTVLKDKKYGVMDTKGNTIVPIKYIETRYGNFGEKGNGNSWGFFMNGGTNGYRYQLWQGMKIPDNFKIDEQYFDKIDYGDFFVFNNRKNRLYGMKDHEGKIIKKQQFAELRYFPEGFYVGRMPNTGMDILYDRNFKPTRYKGFQYFWFAHDTFVFKNDYYNSINQDPITSTVDSVIVTMVPTKDMRPCKRYHDTADERSQKEREQAMRLMLHPPFRCGFSYSEERRMGEESAHYMTIHPHMIIFRNGPNTGMYIPSTAVFHFKKDSTDIQVAGYCTENSKPWYVVKGLRDKQPFYAISDTNYNFITPEFTDRIPIFLDTQLHYGIARKDSQYQFTDEHFNALWKSDRFIPSIVTRYKGDWYAISDTVTKPQQKAKEENKQIVAVFGYRPISEEEWDSNDVTHQFRETIGTHRFNHQFLLKNGVPVAAFNGMHIADFLPDSLHCGAPVIKVTDSTGKIAFLNTDGSEYLPAINFKYKVVEFLNDHVMMVKKEMNDKSYSLINENNIALIPNAEINHWITTITPQSKKLFQISYFGKTIPTTFTYMRKDGFLYGY